MEPVPIAPSPAQPHRPLPTRSQKRLPAKGALAGGLGAIALAARHWGLTRRRADKASTSFAVGCRAASRAGYKVNEKYKGAVSYGTVSQEELEEAARIRSEYGTDRPKQAKSALPAAKKRLLLKRLKQPGSAKSGYGAVVVQLSSRGREMRDEEQSAVASSEDPSQEEADKDSVSEESAEAPPQASEAQLLSGGASQAKEGSDSTNFPGLADTVLRRRAVCLESWEGWPPAMALSAARRLAEDPRRSAAASLQAAVRALSTAEEHALAASLLLSLRDGGVEREVLERRISIQGASALFEEVTVRLGLELQAAGLLGEAWEALMAASAQPELTKSLRKPTLKALAVVSERLANGSSCTPREQVRYLQGALDAEVVLQGLSRDRREGLELYMALALEKAGRVEESRHLLEAVARRGTSRRKRQAEWALLVQDADVGEEPPESVTEMRSIWGQAEVPGSEGGRGGGAGRAMLKRKSQAPFFQSSGAATVAAVAVLALPLALPLLLTLR